MHNSSILANDNHVLGTLFLYNAYYAHDLINLANNNIYPDWLPFLRASRTLALAVYSHISTELTWPNMLIGRTCK